MSAYAERVLLAHLLDRDSLTTLALEGLAPDCIPTEEFRRPVQWALDYFRRGGRTQAPSERAFREEFGDLIEDFEVDLGPPEDTLEWALLDLRSSYAHLQGQQFNKRMATDLAGAESDEIPEVVSRYAGELVELSLQLEPAVAQYPFNEALDYRFAAYRERTEQTDEVKGLSLGFPAVDRHTLGIQPGELAVIAAAPKAGKSYFMLWIALAEWQRGRNVCLYSLENSPAMAWDRLFCMGAGISARRWQQGALTDEEVERFGEWAEANANIENELRVIQPALDRRTMAHMVEDAQVRGADSILIDQLTFVDLGEAGRKPKHERIGDALHRLKAMISTGGHPLSCVLAHQIKREGIRMAAKTGRYQMDDMAEASEVERTVDWGFSLYRSEDDRVAHRALMQTLAARREDIKDWELQWDIDIGNLGVRREVTGHGV